MRTTLPPCRVGARIHNNIQKLSPAHSKSSVKVVAAVAIVIVVFDTVMFAWPCSPMGQKGKGLSMSSEDLF